MLISFDESTNSEDPTDQNLSLGQFGIFPRDPVVMHSINGRPITHIYDDEAEASSAI